MELEERIEEVAKEEEALQAKVGSVTFFTDQACSKISFRLPFSDRV